MFLLLIVQIVEHSQSRLPYSCLYWLYWSSGRSVRVIVSLVTSSACKSWIKRFGLRKNSKIPGAHFIFVQGKWIISLLGEFYLVNQMYDSKILSEVNFHTSQEKNIQVWAESKEKQITMTYLEWNPKQQPPIMWLISDTRTRNTNNT